MWVPVAIGAWLFWIIIIAWVLAEWRAVHVEQGFFSFCLFVAFLLALTFFSDVGIDWFWWAGRNLFSLNGLAFIIGYLVLGAGWSVARWYFYCLSKADDYEKMRDYLQLEWHNSGHADPTRLEAYKPYKEYVTDRGYYPEARSNKERIIIWMVWWWISVTDSFFTDMLYRVFEAIYERLAKVYHRIMLAVFGRFEELQDNAPPPQRKR